MSLADLSKKYLDTLGREKVSELLGVKPSTVATWATRGSLPLAELDKLIAADPALFRAEFSLEAAPAAPAAEVAPTHVLPEPGNKLIILMPCTGNPERDTMRSLIRMYDPKEMRFEIRSFNNLSIVRNQLAQIWLDSGCQWAFWADADMVFPCGDAPWFRQACDLPQMPEIYAGVHTIYRMLVHKQPFVSVNYVARRRGGAPQWAGGEQQHANIRRGPRQELRAVDWCGFGGVLMDVKVLKAIIETQGEEIRVKNPYLTQRFGYKYRFFTPLDQEVPGEDITFSHRAVKAGFKPVVDLSVFAGHIGTKAFNYTD